MTNCGTISFSRTSLHAVNSYDFTYIKNVPLGINGTPNKTCLHLPQRSTAGDGQTPTAKRVTEGDCKRRDRTAITISAFVCNCVYTRWKWTFRICFPVRSAQDVKNRPNHSMWFNMFCTSFLRPFVTCKWFLKQVWKGMIMVSFQINFLLLINVQEEEKSSHNSRYPSRVLNPEPYNTKQKCSWQQSSARTWRPIISIYLK